MGRSVRRTLLVGLALVCGVTAMSATPAVAAKKKLRVWLGTEWCWRQIETRFEKENPNVDIQLIGGTLDKFYTMITAGLMPDMWGIWGTAGITADVNRNWALDLGPYIKRDAAAMNINDFFPGVMRQFKVRGRQYSLPIFSYSDWFFYNTTMYAKAGLAPPPIDAKDKSWNWEQMLSNAVKTTKRSADGNRIVEAGIDFSRDFNCTPNWVRLWGAQLYSDEALRTSIPQDINLTSPQFQNGLTKMWELIYKNKVAPAAAMGFSGGKVASSIEHGWTVCNDMRVKNLKWAIAPLPWAVTDSGTLWPDGWRISRISKDKELAWKFVKYLSSPESMKLLASDPKSERWGSGVARKSVFADTLGTEVGRATGMAPGDVYKVNEQADEAGVVKEYETICLHADLSIQYLEPVLNQVWANKIGPKEGSTKLDEAGRRGMQLLYKRWMRNVQFTGVDVKN